MENVKSFLSESPGFSPSINLLEETPPNPKEKFQIQIKDSSYVHLILGANVVNIILSDDLQTVQHLIVRSVDGHEWPVKSRIFILACGTIENARILLCSNTQVKGGIGNTTDWVGRNLIDHPKGFSGLLSPFFSNQDFLEAQSFFDNNHKRLEVGISIHSRLQQEWEIPNHYIRLVPHQYEDGRKIYTVKFYLEQLPNAESRLFLSEERDVLDMPLACLDWKFRELDFICFKRFVNKLNLLLSSNKLGQLIIDETCYDLNFLKDASHQMGTTRMAADPNDGVVDVNCKVFGVDNLYMMGSSVFPTGGSANPTFTILALARRLASHLKLSH